VPALQDGLPGCAVVPREPAELGAAITTALAVGGSPALRQRAEETSDAAVARRLAALYSDVLQRRRR
jgi:hypothetical protein